MKKSEQIKLLKQQLLETTILAHNWMCKHDILLGFIQNHPELIKLKLKEENSNATE